MKKQLLNILILIFVIVGILYFSLKDNFNEVVSHLANFNLFWLIIAIVLVLGYWLCKSISLHMLIKLIKKDYSFSRTFKLIIITQFFNGITPFASGGQPGQVYLLSKDKIKTSVATNLCIQTFIFYQIALIVYGFFAISYNKIFNLYPEVSVLKNLVTIGFIMNFLVMLALFMMSFCRNVNEKIILTCLKFLNKIKIVKNIDKRREKIHNTLNNFYESANLLKGNPSLVVKGILINFLGLTCLYALPVVIFYGLGNYVEVSPIDAIVSSAYVMIMGSFVPIPGGSGGLEYGFTRFFGTFTSPIIVTSAMLIWRSISYYLGMILGSITLALRKKEVK